MRLVARRTDFAGRVVTGDSFACALPEGAPEGRVRIRVTVHASRGPNGIAVLCVPYLPTEFTAPGITSGAFYPTNEWVELPEECTGRTIAVFLPPTTAQENAAVWTWQGSVLVEAIIP